MSIPFVGATPTAAGYDMGKEEAEEPSQKPVRRKLTWLALVTFLCTLLLVRALLSEGFTSFTSFTSFTNGDLGAPYAPTQPLVGVDTYRSPLLKFVSLKRSACAPLAAAVDRHSFYFKGEGGQQDSQRAWLAAIPGRLCGEPPCHTRGPAPQQAATTAGHGPGPGA